MMELILDGLSIIGTFYDMGLCRANLRKYENVIEFCIIVLTREPNPTDTLHNKALTLENFR